MRAGKLDLAAMVRELPGELPEHAIPSGAIVGHEAAIAQAIEVGLASHRDEALSVLTDLDAREGGLGLGAVIPATPTPAVAAALDAIGKRILPTVLTRTSDDDLKVAARALGVAAKIGGPTAAAAVERALRYKAQTFRGRIGPNELVIPAIRGLEGSLVYLVDRFGTRGSIYDVDFTVAPGAARKDDCGLTRIDHVAQVMPRGQLDGTLLFYKSVFGFEAEPAHELVDPYGLIQSRVVQSRDHTIRMPLNTSTSPKTSTARFMSTYSGAGVHHIAITTQDVFATIRAMRRNGVPLLEIPGAYYENLAATHDLASGTIEDMQKLSILYDRSG
ncbi:MAG: VOC family protein, partial [Sandaracinaceae bacterium]|nr:VOC family protein [Sandaracinaceae bacterium]